jgi:hypothetical protein
MSDDSFGMAITIPVMSHSAHRVTQLPDTRHPVSFFGRHTQGNTGGRVALELGIARYSWTVMNMHTTVGIWRSPELMRPAYTVAQTCAVSGQACDGRLGCGVPPHAQLSWSGPR